MTKRSKTYLDSIAMIDKTKNYTVDEAVELVKKTSSVKFDATIELAINTTANPKYNDQMIRGTMILPNGTGKTKRVAVFVSEDNLDEAKKSWADVFGSADLIADIKAEKLDFDILITTPDSIRELAVVAKLLGPKWLMPSPKAGTVTNELAKSVEEFKKGKIEYKLDKTWNIHMIAWKVSFDDEKLKENINFVISTLFDNKPTGIKWRLIKKAVLSSSMWPGVPLQIVESK